MPLNEFRLQLRFDEIPQIDCIAASQAIKCLHGRVVLEMLPAKEMFGNLYLPDNLRDNGRTDLGIVVAVGEDIPLTLGELVICRGYDGTWRNDFKCGGYQPKGQLRFYGVVCLTRGEPQLVPWWDSIVAGFDMTTRTITPTGANILIRRDPEITQEGSILLSCDSTYRSNFASVVSVGPLINSVSVGDRILYVPNGTLDFDEIIGDVDLALISEDAIEAVITPPIREPALA